MLWHHSVFSQKAEWLGPSERESHLELGTQVTTLKDLQRSLCPGGLRQLHYWSVCVCVCTCVSFCGHWSCPAAPAPAAPAMCTRVRWYREKDIGFEVCQAEFIRQA